MLASLLLMGRILGAEKRAAEFIDFYIAQMRQATKAVDAIPAQDRPLVAIENAAGWQSDFCCWSFGPQNFGRFVELADGVTYASTLANAYSVDISLKGLMEADPDHLIGTGANWIEARPEVSSTLLGYEGNPAVNAEKLQALADRTGFAELRVVKEGNLLSNYHQFYTSPYHFIAVQQIATWLYPDDFKDLNVGANFKGLHNKFLPFEATGQFWATLN